VISSPRTLQMIALSATVSNVDDIVGWFSATHGPTELVASDFRSQPSLPYSPRCARRLFFPYALLARTCSVQSGSAL
jgi:superfamily II RNA helicase